MYALFIYNVSQILITNINIYLINFYYLKVIDVQHSNANIFFPGGEGTWSYIKAQHYIVKWVWEDI